MAVTQETLRAVDRLRQQLLTLTDAQTVAITRAWVEAWDGLLPEFQLAIAELVAGADGNIPRSKVARSQRLAGALQAARAALEELGPRSAEIVTLDVDKAVSAAIEAQQAIVTSQLPPGTVSATINFTPPPDPELFAIVERTTQQIHSNYMPLPADVERAMKRELVRGIAVGDNPELTARRLIKRTESRFNGGLARAINISRTEMLDAHRAASQASDKANREVLADWEWHAQLDARTCPSCLAQHGNRFPVDEAGPLDHQQGRCARIPRTKTWKELGFDIEEPESEGTNAEDWFNNLTPDTQKQIMGPARLKLLQDGDIKWSDLSRRGTNPGWRDSYNVPSVKNLK